jgi:hypothetical protein
MRKRQFIEIIVERLIIKKAIKIDLENYSIIMLIIMRHDYMNTVDS